MRLKVLLFSMFLLSSNVSAIDCLNPFEGRSQNFLLQEPLNCAVLQTPVDLYIKNMNDTSISTLNRSSYFLQSECIHDVKSDYKVMDLLYNKTEIVDWSDKLGNENIFRVQLACKHESLGILDFRRERISLPQGNVEVAVRVYKNDESQTLIAYVQQNEYLPNHVTVRMASDGSVAMSAEKTLIQNQDTCFANWVVDNPQLDATMASYILGWKDNKDANCNPPIIEKQMSAGSAFLITAGTIGIIASVIGGFTWYYWPQLRHAYHVTQDVDNL